MEVLFTFTQLKITMYRSTHSLSARLLLGMFLMFSSIIACAQKSEDSETRAYIGGGYLSGTFDSNTCKSCEGKPGFNFFTGMEVADFFALEVGYLSVNNIYWPYDFDAIYFTPIARLPLHENGSALTARVGVHGWNRARGSGYSSVNGAGLLYGVGVDIASPWATNMRTQITYTRYAHTKHIGDTAYDNIDGFAINLKILF